MPAYTFEALDAQGQTRKGVMEAETVKAARSQLRAQTLVPLKVEPVLAGAADGAGANAKGGFFAPRVFNATKLAIWTRQIAGLISSGLPLERALTALTDEAEDEKQRNLIAALRAEVNGGSSFARALGQHPREFSEIYIAVIGAGEQSGHLGGVLERLADDLEESQALKAKLIGAALYPAIVTVIAIAIVIFLVSYVVPQVASVFAGTKRALPFLTVAMLALSAVVRQRLVVASTLAMLAGAGVPILKALQAAAQTLSNQAMRSDALDALVLVREGAPLASALAQKKRFPGLLAMFARLGEQTGQLPLMLQRAAAQLSTEVQRRAMALATLLEPLLIVAMGGMVMLIVLAVLLPIIQLNQWVK
jgi:general secretion pathway protein F